MTDIGPLLAALAEHVANLRAALEDVAALLAEARIVERDARTRPTADDGPRP